MKSLLIINHGYKYKKKCLIKLFSIVKLQSKVQTSVFLGLGVDFVLPLSQQQEQQPPPKLEFDTKDQVLSMFYIGMKYFLCLLSADI